MLKGPEVRKLPQLFGLIGITAGVQLPVSVEANTGGVPALYSTKAEAEAAAKQHFNCTGAHQMGTQWMPCDKHGQNSDSTHTH